ncbi:MAG: endonuclease domain-containing protein, partial [Devosia sp.]
MPAFQSFKRARELRSDMTEPERALWYILRRKQIGLRFRRQHPIGSYILDFYCASARLCVEVDGPIHLQPDQIEHDRQRGAWLVSQGVRVIRFTSADVTERPAAVVAAIAQAAPPPPPP